MVMFYTGRILTASCKVRHFRHSKFFLACLSNKFYIRFYRNTKASLMDFSPRNSRPGFDFINFIWTLGFKCFQLVLFFSFLGLATFMTYSYFYDICKLHYLVTQNSFFTLVQISILTYSQSI